MVLLGTPQAPTALAIKAAQAIAYAPQFLVSYSVSPSKLASDLGGGVEPARLTAGFKQLTGVITSAYLRSAVEDVDDPAMKEHRRIMETFGGPAVSGLTVYAQSLAELVVETLERACDNLTRPGLLHAAESVTGFQPSLLLPGIAVDLSAADHYAVQSLQPVQLQADGRLRALSDAISGK